MQQYLDLVKDILENGVDKSDRTGVGTRSVVGRTMRFNLEDGFPLLTTKKVHFKSVVAELLWFLEGSTDNNRLRELGATIWDEWALEDGSLGPIYGEQWRNWTTGVPLSELEALVNNDELDDGELLVELKSLIRWHKGHPIDQIANIVKTLRERPMSRRIILSGWNPVVLPDESISPQENVRQGRAALPACHTLAHFIAEPLSGEERLRLLADVNEPIDLDIISLGELDRLGVPAYRLNCVFYCRSQDVALGTPFNIASYALLTEMIAQVTNMMPGELVWVGGDVHLYQNHIDLIQEQLSREPRELPQIVLNPNCKELSEFTMDDITLINYDHHPAIKFPVAV